MYSWIWRRLPFGLAGKLASSLLITSALVALLWYVVFPKAEPLLPFDDVQVTQDSGGSTEPGGDDPGLDGGGQPEPGDGHDIPYATTEQRSPTPATTNR
jgi:hypothetical protein